MKLHSVFVTYNRLELTKRTIASYLETVSVPYTMTVVDNASTDGTREWLLTCGVEWYPQGTLHLLNENRYPGFAANVGLGHVPPDATHLHRSDNDVEYLPGWCGEVAERFEDASVWQVGLRTVEEEGAHGAVGGNCVIHRDAWTAGVRYSEEPWTRIPFEDAVVGQRINRLGHIWVRVAKPCIVHTGLASRDDPYYQRTFAERGITFEQYGL